MSICETSIMARPVTIALGLPHVVPTVRLRRFRKVKGQ
jgi:hypothetical protein